MNRKLWPWRLPAACLLASLALAGAALGPAPDDKLVKGKDGKAVGYTDTPMLPWAPSFHKHDPDRPLPRKVSAVAVTSAAPSDALVLFDGKDVSKWKPTQWRLEGDALVAVGGDLESRDGFGDCQLHLEWAAPAPPQGEQMNRGNSGVFMMGRYEIQIFDSYTEAIYADGSAAAVYGETPPLVNATGAPGQWQSYDIFFTRPRFQDGKLTAPARLTMLHNGVLVHLDTQIHGPVSHRTIAGYAPHGEKEPLKLQFHGNPVRFRNIWIRPL